MSSDDPLLTLGGRAVTVTHVASLAAVVLAALFLWLSSRSTKSSATTTSRSNNNASSDGGGDDDDEGAPPPLNPAQTAQKYAAANVEYLSTTLRVDCDPWDVVFAVATTPENVFVTSARLAETERLRRRKTRRLEEERTASVSDAADDGGGGGGGAAVDPMSVDDDGGWASSDDEGEDDEARAAAEAAKKHEEEERKQKRALNATMGRVDPSDIKLEGVDEGVIGPKWVAERLREQNRWPPRVPDGAASATFEVAATGQRLPPSDHPAVERNLLMAAARLHAMILNSHGDLIKANGGGDVDAPYFRYVMEFRQRCAGQLEIALRIACAARSYRLVRTIVQTVAMFKIGVPDATDPRVLAWFKKTMETQHGVAEGVPRLEVKNQSLTPAASDEEDKDEDKDKDAGEETKPTATNVVLAAGEELILSVDVERVHAEAFFKQRIENCKKQGIPPQIALQSFREVWWVLVRRRRTDNDDDGNDPTPPAPPGSLAAIASKLAAAEERRYRLVHAYPFVVAQINKREGTIKAKLKAPSTPGTYSFDVSILSQEFLGCDVDLEIADVVVADAASVTRTKKTAQKD